MIPATWEGTQKFTTNPAGSSGGLPRILWKWPHNRGQALCCGAGGGMRAAYPGTSIKMAGHCLQEATEIEADILLTNCNSCLHNLKNAQKRYSHFRKDKLGIYNLGQYLNLLLDGPE